MSVDVVYLFQVKLASTQLQVGCWENTDIEWLPTVNKNPLSEVKLSLSTDIASLKAEWPFNVLLDYFLLRMLRILNDLGKFIHTVDSHATSIVRRFHNPNIPNTVYLPVLWKQL